MWRERRPFLAAILRVDLRPLLLEAAFDVYRAPSLFCWVIYAWVAPWGYGSLINVRGSPPLPGAVSQ